MTQYIDKSAIVAEIEKRLKFQQTCIKTGYRLIGKPEEEIILEYKQLLSFIDSLPEEPVSEELEKASKNYALNNTPWDDCKDEIQESFKAGAKWQEQKDKEALDIYLNSQWNKGK